MAPSISVFAVPMKVRHGSNFTVTCGGTGNPKPAVRWRRNDTTDLVADGIHVVNSGNTLFIIGATSQDSGLYECVLTNSLGVARRDGTLVVQGSFMIFVVSSIVSYHHDWNELIKRLIWMNRQIKP